MTPHLTVVHPKGMDGSSDHAVCVGDDIVFDARLTHALKLRKETFDWVCGPHLGWISMENSVDMREFPVCLPAHGVLFVFLVPKHRPIMPREITPVQWMRPEEFSIMFVLCEQHKFDGTKTFGTIPYTQRTSICVLKASDGKSRKRRATTTAA
jgi:hypothetical protein